MMTEATNKFAKDMTLDELYAIGARADQDLVESGTTPEGRNWILRRWISGLVEWLGVDPAIGDALRERFYL